MCFIQLYSLFIDWPMYFVILTTGRWYVIYYYRHYPSLSRQYLSRNTKTCVYKRQTPVGHSHIHLPLSHYGVREHVRLFGYNRHNSSGGDDESIRDKTRRLVKEGIRRFGYFISGMLTLSLSSNIGNRLFKRKKNNTTWMQKRFPRVLLCMYNGCVSVCLFVCGHSTDFIV